MTDHSVQCIANMYSPFVYMFCIGTGKSVFGAHLAYAFIVANNPDFKFVTSTNDEKIKCVMYCGPSNKSVDVVLGMYNRKFDGKILKLDILCMICQTKNIQITYYL